MSTLVTGAAGFIGSHLCERLLEAGEIVVGLDSFDDFYAPESKERNLCASLDYDAFTLVRGDVCDPATLAALPDDVELVVHLAARAAARASLDHPALYVHVNVAGTATLLEWARTRGIKAVVNASSSSVYGDLGRVPFSEDDATGRPLSPYGATKAAAELLCESYCESSGLTIASLRYFTVFGPRQRPDLAIHKFARILSVGGSIPLYGDGTSSRDYTFVDDVVAGTQAALRWAAASEARHRVFNIASGEPVTLSEMARALADIMGVRLFVEHMSAHAGDLPNTRADIGRARRELGYSPQTGFHQGLQRFVEWLADGDG